MADIFDKVSAEMKEMRYKEPEPERGILSSLFRGLRSGSTGALLGAASQRAPKDESFVEHLASLGGEVISDIPAFIAGGALGAIGGPVGSTAGAIALPTAIKTGRAELEKLSQKPTEVTIEDALGSLYTLGKETAKSAIVGGTTGAAGKILGPILTKIPGLDKLANSKLGRAAIGAGVEYGGLTGSKALVEQELPSKQELIDNALIIGGLKGAELIGGRISQKRAGKPFIPEEIKGKTAAYTPEVVKDITESVKKFTFTPKKKEWFGKLKDFLGERDAQYVKSTFKWKNEFDRLVKKHNIPKQDLADMIYYRQKTGNPFIEGDTYEALRKRMHPESKKFVKTVIDTHLKNSLKEWNENPLTKNINPREGMEEFYLPGLYEYDAEKFARATADISKRFKEKNPLANTKVFLNYLDAYEKAGLKPRYKNIFDIMQAYDRTMIKALANTKLVNDIKNIEKATGEQIIVRAPRSAELKKEKMLYEQAKKMGYEPFRDPFLRKGSEMPALVNPDFASAFQGVFSRDAYKPEHPFWKSYDKASNLVRYFRVSASPLFHYTALGESGLGALGPKIFRLPSIMKRGRMLRGDREFMMDAARSGLKLKRPELGIEKVKRGLDKLSDSAFKRLPDKFPGKGIFKSGMGKLIKAQNYLFQEFHPNLKAFTWRDLVQQEIDSRKSVSDSELKLIKRDVAEYVNDIYGGQNWDRMRFVNNERNRKLMSRTVGYPDWTVSAARQAANVLNPGLKGKLARKYWLRYGVGLASITGLLKFMYNGLVQRDEKNNSIKGIRFDFKRAVDKTLSDQPGTWFKIPLPDLPVKIAGKVRNFGRNERGERLYTHFGKQALEIGNYIRPMNQMFVKANPLVQMFLKQVLGVTPYKDQYFTVRGKYKGGKFMPWDATEEFSPERLVSRGKAVLDDVMPFGFKSFYEQGGAPFIAAGAGAIPISKGLTLFKSEPYIEEALKTKNVRLLARIKSALRENKYTDRQIKSRITRVKNKLRAH